MDLVQILTTALKEAREIVLSRENVVTEHGSNIQTSADLSAEEHIIKVLRENNVPCTIHSEELDEPVHLGDQYEIIVDPIDGSFFFLHGITTFTSIAAVVLENRVVKYAFVQSVGNTDLYHCDESAAYLNGQRIVCDTANVPQPYLITGYGARREQHDVASKLAKLPSEYYFLNDGGPKLSAMVATNNLDAAIEFAPTRLNEMTGAFIAQKAGAFVETIEGKPLTIDPMVRQTLITARSEELLRSLQNVLS